LTRTRPSITENIPVSDTFTFQKQMRLTGGPRTEPFGGKGLHTFGSPWPGDAAVEQESPAASGHTTRPREQGKRLVHFKHIILAGSCVH
jgi:hypothetical protein